MLQKDSRSRRIGVWQEDAAIGTDESDGERHLLEEMEARRARPPAHTRVGHVEVDASAVEALPAIVQGIDYGHRMPI